MTFVSAIIPAAGSSVRFGGSTHKPFVLLAGKPILYWTLEKITSLDCIHQTIVALHPADMQKRLELEENFPSLECVVGGERRADSVRNALRKVSPSAELVLIHDSARPLAPLEKIQDTIDACSDADGAILALPVSDTIKAVEGGNISASLNREKLWRAQTPQVFHREVILRAHQQGKEAGLTCTDDSQLAEKLGYTIRVVEGSPLNIKITTPDDLFIAEAILLRSSPSS